MEIVQLSAIFRGSLMASARPPSRKSALKLDRMSRSDRYVGGEAHADKDAVRRPADTAARGAIDPACADWDTYAEAGAVSDVIVFFGATIADAADAHAIRAKSSVRQT